jgi:hypothetical protein
MFRKAKMVGESMSLCNLKAVRLRDWVFAGLAAVALGFGADGQAALVTADVGIAALEPDFLDDFSHHESAVGPVSSFLEKQEYFRGGLGLFAYHGIGTASASYLSLGASSRVILNDYTSLEYDSTQLIQSVAQLNDDITVPGSGPGFFELKFHLSGNGGSSNPSLILGGVFFNANINFLGGVTLNSFSLGFLPQGDVTTGLIPITLGVPFHITAQLQTTVQSLGPGSDPGPIDAGIFYGNTAALTGVQAYDSDRNPLESFTVLSDSGTDYLNIPMVPEPAAAFLLAPAAVAALRRTRKKGAELFSK